MSDFQEAIASGDYRKSLEALRDRIAADILSVDGCHTAPLAKQLADVLAKLDTLKPAEESRVDDLAARRADRRAAKPQKRAPRKVAGSGK